MFSESNAVVLVEWHPSDSELPSSIEDLGHHLPIWLEGKNAQRDHAMTEVLQGLGQDW